jgi:hypothetical protein
MKYLFLIITTGGTTEEIMATSIPNAIAESEFFENEIAHIIRLHPV